MNAPAPQPDLLSWRPLPADKIARAFAIFHEANPDVYDLFIRFTGEVMRAGHARYSADAILHRIRWHTMVERRQNDFKVNNNFSALYARLYLRDHPQHRGFFELRASVVDGDDIG